MVKWVGHDEPACQNGTDQVGIFNPSARSGLTRLVCQTSKPKTDSPPLAQ